MGTFSPCPFWTEKLEKQVMKKIMIPTMKAMNAEGRTFKGCLYFGLMRTDKGMRVVEYNSRFGDPETQVILPMLKTDLLDVFEAVTEARYSDRCRRRLRVYGRMPLSWAQSSFRP